MRPLLRHYGRKVILLVDEYDVPLDKAFQAGYYDDMANLIRNLPGNVLKTNESLYFAVLTGCLRISKESIFTGLNNLKVHTISDVRYDEFFGFTDEDVDELLKFYGLASCKSVIQAWYDGYRFGNVDVYCPWDVINYCDELLADPTAPPQNYWANTSGNDLILRLLKKADQTTKGEVEELINSEDVTKKIKQELTYRDIDDSVENIWSVLYAAGYLTGSRVSQADADLFRLWIPNGEIRRLFSDLVQDWFREVTRSDFARINRLCCAFTVGDALTVQEMLLGLLRSQENWMVKSNAETGEGYSDISICTQDRIEIVIELKYADNGNLETACAEALKQIEERQYAQGLKRWNTNKILKYGIAFWEKECMVRMA